MAFEKIKRFGIYCFSYYRNCKSYLAIPIFLLKVLPNGESLVL